MSIYEVGDKIPLSQIIPGDKIRFETKYQRPQEDTVEYIWPMEEGLRSRVFLDTRKHSINLFPDTVTDAFLIEKSPERAALEEAERVRMAEETAKFDAEETKREKAFATFKSLSRGSVFATEYNGVWMLYTKLKKNRWSIVETFDNGQGAQLNHEDDTYVFEQLYNEESGNCYGLMNGRPLD